MIERDLYGQPVTRSITPPDLLRADFTSKARNAIALKFDQPVGWTESLMTQFFLDGVKGQITSATVAGNVVTLMLKRATNARSLTYLKEMSWNPENLLIGKNGIAALTFCDVPIGSPF